MRCGFLTSWRPISFDTQMLLRIEDALQNMVSAASQTDAGCVAAVAHSAYLRMLLATVSDTSFLAAYNIQQRNCCINVLDFERGAVVVTNNKNRNNNSNRAASLMSLPGGAPISSLPLDLRIPAGRVERINETRHLEAIEFA